MKMKKAFATLLCALMVSSLVVGCGDKSKSDGKNEKVTIEVAVSGSAQEIEVHQKKFDAYMKLNPDVTIKPIDIGADRVQKTLTLISGGKAPDILYINEMMYAYASKNVVHPLDDLIKKSNFDVSNFQENLLDPLTYEGKLYGLPQEISPFCIFYNKDMFKAANVPLPTDDWTVEEFYAAAKALTNAEKKVYGYRLPGGWADQIWNWITISGADYSVMGEKTKGFDSPEVLKSLTFLQDMVLNDKVSPNPADLAAMGKGADVMFVNKTVAMESAGLWMLPTYKANKLDFDWDVVRVPRDANQNCMAGVLNWAISKQSKHVDEAWDVLQFLVGPEGMKIVADTGMALPGSKDEAAIQTVLDSKFPANVSAFVDSVDSVDFRMQKNVYYTQVNDALNTEVELMLLGKQTPEETQNNLIKKFDKALSGK